MNPLDHLSPAMERLWIDEVRRLHSLWHRGPPRDHANSGTLAASRTTTFKREEPRKRNAKERQRHKNKTADSSTVEWPCNPEPSSAADGFRTWDDVCPSRPAPATVPVSAERQASIAASRAQSDGVRASKGFFSAMGSPDGEDDDETMYDEDDHDSDDIESRCFGFFLDVFDKDGELNSYYRKNWEKGEFCCLVCLGIGEKLSKKYGDCISLVQHSNSIANTKGRTAHRAFVRVLCQVLGWDINRLPTIIINPSKQPGEAGDKSAQEEGTNKGVISGQLESTELAEK